MRCAQRGPTCPDCSHVLFSAPSPCRESGGLIEAGEIDESDKEEVEAEDDPARVEAMKRHGRWWVRMDHADLNDEAQDEVSRVGHMEGKGASGHIEGKGASGEKKVKRGDCGRVAGQRYRLTGQMRRCLQATRASGQRRSSTGQYLGAYMPQFTEYHYRKGE